MSDLSPVELTDDEVDQIDKAILSHTYNVHVRATTHAEAYCTTSCRRQALKEAIDQVLGERV